MKLLILGGTVFLGRAAAKEALARDHELTLFNRGRSNPDVLPEAEHLHGDRDGGLSALRGRRWDAVIDTSGYLPRIVRDSAQLLAESAGHYTFVSSISVYRAFSRPGFDEQSPVIELDDPATEDVAENYGGLKALCEEAVADAFGSAAAVVRAGLLVGPHDPTGRFTYWPERFARGGEVLVPGPPERLIQFIDARDLGTWLVRLAEERVAGTFNASGPPLPVGELVDSCLRVSGNDARPVWVDEGFLLEQEVGQWLELPLWIAGTDPDWRHMQEADVSRALAAGLTLRPLDETVADTLAWSQARSNAATDREREAGLTPEREAALLAEWSKQRAGSGRT